MGAGGSGHLAAKSGHLSSPYVYAKIKTVCFCLVNLVGKMQFPRGGSGFSADH